MEHINIAAIRAGDLVWECGDGQDALLLALTDAKREQGGVSVQTIDVQDGERVRLFEGHPAYGPRLYSAPQYTRPDWPALLGKIAACVRDLRAEDQRQASAREAGLQLAATQYSESRDRWQTAKRRAQAEIAELRTAISEALCVVERGGQNGIEVSERVKSCLERAARARMETPDA
jgi:hypothetical protein